MHLYVHIPFCHRICPYCSFYKHTPASTDLHRFVDALLVEAESRRDALTAPGDHTCRTLYFGGGTPSMLSATHLRRLVGGLDDIIGCDSLDEFSFEANPATFTERKAGLWVDLGITRISLGVQSWDPAILSLLGREHTPAQAAQSVRVLREAGMREINIDLMYSIPGQTLDSWRDTLDQTIALAPDHISAYNLTYEEDTDFFNALCEGRYEEDESRDVELFEYTHDKLTAAGYRHYETSNFALGDRLSRHNMGYWQGDDYIGLGPGAVSTLSGTRIRNTEDTNRYIESTLLNGLPDSEQEKLSDDDRLLERLSLMLRTDTGFPLALLPDVDRDLIQRLESNGMAEVNHSAHLILKGTGRLLVDEVVTEISR